MNDITRINQTQIMDALGESIPIESTPFSYRIAQLNDIPQIIDLMKLAIEINMRSILSPEAIEAAKEAMGVDQSLIQDQTYFLIEATEGDQQVLVGCGGWGKRRTLYGGNQTKGRDDSLSDPATEAARIRAMYTHPNWTRRGIGKLLLSLGEQAAKSAGFKKIELGSTLAGEPLYKACGYQETERETLTAANGETSTVIKMVKSLV